MKQSPLRSFGRHVKVLLVCAVVLVPGSFTSRGQDVHLDPTMAANAPDQFNWTLFVSLCRKAPAGEQTEINHGGKNFQSNNAIWETWADNELTFPTNFNAAKPNWNDRLGPKKVKGSGLETL